MDEILFKSIKMTILTLKQKTVDVKMNMDIIHQMNFI